MTRRYRKLIGNQNGAPRGKEAVCSFCGECEHAAGIKARGQHSPQVVLLDECLHWTHGSIPKGLLTELMVCPAGIRKEDGDIFRAKATTGRCRSHERKLTAI